MRMAVHMCTDLYTSNEHIPNTPGQSAPACVFQVLLLLLYYCSRTCSVTPATAATALLLPGCCCCSSSPSSSPSPPAAFAFLFARFLAFLLAALLTNSAPGGKGLPDCCRMRPGLLLLSYARLNVGPLLLLLIAAAPACKCACSERMPGGLQTQVVREGRVHWHTIIAQRRLALDRMLETCSAGGSNTCRYRSTQTKHRIQTYSMTLDVS